jgi:hypothetical protein
VLMAILWRSSAALRVGGSGVLEMAGRSQTLRQAFGARH